MVEPWGRHAAPFQETKPPVIPSVSRHASMLLRRQPIEVPGAGPSEQKSRSGLPLDDALSFAHRSCAQKLLEQFSQAAAAALLDAERRLGSTLPLHHHHGIAQASYAWRMFLRQDADLIDRR